MNQPYYIIPVVEKYKSLSPHSEEAEKLALLISLNIGDKETLESILDPHHIQLINGPKHQETHTTISSHYPTVEPETKESSMNTIDSFLDKFGANIGPVGYLAQTHFGEEQTPKQEKKDFHTQDELSELKMLIKTKHYNEALMLIEQQNLNNPQKSIYFAHQMRFIKKLMAIENYKNKT